MTDRERLTKAIDWARDQANIHREKQLEPARSYMAGLYTTLADAAQAWADTLPKINMVEAWRVEYAFQSGISGKWSAGQSVHSHEMGARLYASDLAKSDRIACIKVTGPHMQEVPA